MKALDEYFVMVVFTLFLNTVHVFANFVFNWTEKHGSERDKHMLQKSESISEGFKCQASLLCIQYNCECFYLLSRDRSDAVAFL